MNRVQVVVILCFTLVGCSGPAKWAEEVELQLQCDMTIDEVQSLAGRPVTAWEVPRGWLNYSIRDGDTELWLGFVNDKLKWVQVAWDVKLTRTAKYQRIDLCGLDPSNPDVKQRITSQ